MTAAHSRLSATVAEEKSRSAADLATSATVTGGRDDQTESVEQEEFLSGGTITGLRVGTNRTKSVVGEVRYS